MSNELHFPETLTPTTIDSFPIAIVGAGPIGLAAAAHLAQRGLRFVIIEAGAEAGHSVTQWQHVQLFSPWRYCIDSTVAALLSESKSGWTAPDADHFPTGAELITEYLRPLAAHPSIHPHLRTHTCVRTITRAGRDKLAGYDREHTPFVLHLAHADGSESRMLARAIIDASGTWSSPNPLGADGTPAMGERAASANIHYGIPDMLHSERSTYAGARVLVVGSGHSAFQAVLDPEQLMHEAPGTRAEWAVRRTDFGRMFGGGIADQLPGRGELGTRADQLLRRGAVPLHRRAHIISITQNKKGALHVHTEDERELGPFDRIIAATGFRPNLDMLRELRLDLDDRCEAPRALAPLIDPNLHSCGSVPPHGADELQHTAEPGFFTVGMKSYGRAPTFLMLTGYEQVRSVAAALAGDWQAARDVRLVLPETGVCCAPDDSQACCAPTGLVSFGDIPITTETTTQAS